MHPKGSSARTHFVTHTPAPLWLSMPSPRLFQAEKARQKEEEAEEKKRAKAQKEAEREQKESEKEAEKERLRKEAEVGSQKGGIVRSLYADGCVISL